MSLSRKSPLKPGKPLARSGFRAKAPGAARKTLKARQLARSPADIELHDRLAQEIGCIACMKDGHRNTHVSIHHIDGRTKPGCHQLVLPLCGSHHQDDGSGLLAVHPWKARFEKRYGAQLDLLAECLHLLNLKGMP
jgi:hypothetical protein